MISYFPPGKTDFEGAAFLPSSSHRHQAGTVNAALTVTDVRLVPVLPGNPERPRIGPSRDRRQRHRPGVGFRPFVHGLATRLGLGGFVKNQTGGVLIEVEGETLPWIGSWPSSRPKPPPLARIDELRWSSRPSAGRSRGSGSSPARSTRSSPIFISPDVATCDDCLAELFDPGDRRYRYPFLNCTNCGPRLTIITGAPVRPPAHDDGGVRDVCRVPRGIRRPARPPVPRPADRLPGLRSAPRAPDHRGQPIATADPHRLGGRGAARRARSVAIKGLGGYHLACRSAG